MCAFIIYVKFKGEDYARTGGLPDSMKTADPGRDPDGKSNRYTYRSAERLCSELKNSLSSKEEILPSSSMFLSGANKVQEIEL